MSVVSTRSDSSEELDQFAAVFRLIAEVLTREIDSEMHELLRLPAVKEIITGTEPAVTSLLETPWNESVQEDHAVEFCRLFIRPCVCNPIANAWVRDAQEEQFSIRRWIDLDESPSDLPKHFSELPDNHIGKILAIRAGMTEMPEETISTFHEQMIEPWCGKFAASLAQSADLPIYRACGLLLEAIGSPGSE